MARVRHYWHAGVVQGGVVVWSSHTRRTRRGAEHEARMMARRWGGTPLVEWWPRSAGLRPGDCEVVVGREEVSG